MTTEDGQLNAAESEFVRQTVELHAPLAEKSDQEEMKKVVRTGPTTLSRNIGEIEECFWGGKATITYRVLLSPYDFLSLLKDVLILINCLQLRARGCKLVFIIAVPAM